MEALKWYRQAAEGGDGYAQWRLGVAYEDGALGLLTDEDEALKWYREAAKSGNGYAQIELAEAYENGLFDQTVDDKGGAEVVPEGGWGWRRRRTRANR